MTLVILYLMVGVVFATYLYQANKEKAKEANWSVPLFFVVFWPPLLCVHIGAIVAHLVKGN